MSRAPPGKLPSRAEGMAVSRRLIRSWHGQAVPSQHAGSLRRVYFMWLMHWGQGCAAWPSIRQLGYHPAPARTQSAVQQPTWLPEALAEVTAT